MTEDLKQLRKDIHAGLPKSRREPAEGEPVTHAKGGRYVGDKFVSREEIVEQARKLLGENWPPADVKRLLVRKFGGHGRAFERHLSVARGRNLGEIKRTRPEAKGDSVHQWRVRMSRYVQAEAKAEQELTSELAKLAEARKAFEAAKPATLEEATLRLEQQTGFMVIAERRVERAAVNIEKHQHTLDRILGNWHPLEHADVSEQLDRLANPPEPLTDEHATEIILAAISKIQDEAVADAMQDVAIPSEN